MSRYIKEIIRVDCGHSADDAVVEGCHACHGALSAWRSSDVPNIAYLKGHDGFGDRKKISDARSAPVGFEDARERRLRSLEMAGHAAIETTVDGGGAHEFHESEDISGIGLGATFPGETKSHRDRRRCPALEEYVANSRLSSVRSMSGRLAGISTLEVQLASVS